MICELVEKLDQAESLIVNIESGPNQDAECINRINSLFTVIDSMIEFYGMPPGLVERYNRMREKYAMCFKDGRVYYSVDRSNRLDNIVQEIDQFVDLTNFISENVEMQGERVDTIATNMEETEMAVSNALNELDSHRAKVNFKIKLWRYTVILLFVIFLVFVYR